jgi:hypothetical protein
MTQQEKKKIFAVQTALNEMLSLLNVSRSELDLNVSVDDVFESVKTLEVYLKYVLLDLESTRREKKYLEEQLDE